MKILLMDEYVKNNNIEINKYIFAQYDKDFIQNNKLLFTATKLYMKVSI